MTTDLTYAEAVAGIRATMADYVHALDDGRTDDVVGTFCPDGGIDLGPMGRHEGLDALREAYAGWVPRKPQRHVVVNTHVTEWNDREATATSDVLFLLKGDDGWAIQLVGRYHDVLHRDGDRWRFHHRRAEFS